MCSASARAGPAAVCIACIAYFHSAPAGHAAAWQRSAVFLHRRAGGAAPWTRAARDGRVCAPGYLKRHPSHDDRRLGVPGTSVRKVCVTLSCALMSTSYSYLSAAVTFNVSQA
jgi:hypothetical protein